MFSGKSQEFWLFLALFILINRNNRINTTRVRIYILSFITNRSSPIRECDKVHIILPREFLMFAVLVEKIQHRKNWQWIILLIMLDYSMRFIQHFVVFVVLVWKIQHRKNWPWIIITDNAWLFNMIYTSFAWHIVAWEK